MRNFFAIAALLLAGACASSQDLDQGLSALVGQQKHHALGRLRGYDSQGEIDGQKYYVWDSRATPPGTCRIRIFTDANDTITKYDWSGTGSTCQYYIGQLNRWK